MLESIQLNWVLDWLNYKYVFHLSKLFNRVIHKTYWKGNVYEMRWQNTDRKVTYTTQISRMHKSSPHAQMCLLPICLFWLLTAPYKRGGEVGLKVCVVKYRATVYIQRSTQSLNLHYKANYTLCFFSTFFVFSCLFFGVCLDSKKWFFCAPFTGLFVDLTTSLWLSRAEICVANFIPPCEWRVCVVILVQKVKLPESKVSIVGIGPANQAHARKIL